MKNTMGLILLSAAIFFGCNDEKKSEEPSAGNASKADAKPSALGTMTDSRDGKNYSTIKIGDATWMATNLNYETEGSFCYNDDPASCEKHGRLYTFNAAKSACPDGWHLPIAREWRHFVEATKGQSLKTAEGWESGNGIDDIKFSVAPAGFRNSKGKYEIQGKRADFWSASADGSSKGKYWFLNYASERVNDNSYSKKGAMSVRCVQGPAPEDEAECGDPRDHGETWEIVKKAKYVTCAEAHDYGCGWHVEGLMATYLNKGESCSDLIIDGTPLSVDQLIDIQKVNDDAFRKILSNKNAVVYFDTTVFSTIVCAYYSNDAEDTIHNGSSDKEVCLPLARADQFLTSFAKDLLN